MVDWWQHLPQNINPIFIQLGPMQIRWYGLMYLMSFLVCYVIFRYRTKKKEVPYSIEDWDQFLTWIIIGIVIGARLGYVFLYNLPYYLSNPLEILLPIACDEGCRFVGLGGLSYHGGLIGGAIATIWFCRRKKIELWAFGDAVISAVPLGYTFGRIGNFLNGELYGKITEVPWGMYFPQAPLPYLRHPSQLYEALLEGLLLWVICWTWRQKRPFDGFLFSIYVIGYGVVRFFIEFLRQPDAHLGYVVGELSIGQIYCLIMILIGLGLFFYRRSRRVV